MPIDSLHPSYKDFSGKWERCRDAYDGQDAIKAKGVKYLPALTEQTTSEYSAYKDRALFFSITDKTVSALVGMAMVRAPLIKMPESMSGYYKDESGIQFYEILAQTVAENLLMARVGLLADMPKDGGDPYPALYTTESIINWETNDIGEPQLVVLKETILVQDPKDRYEKAAVTQYRELSLINGVYFVTVFDEKRNIVEGPTTPTVDGQVMNYIPFTVITPYGVSYDLHKSPMLDIVDINLSHYRTSADLEHGRHFTALPTPVVSGAEAGSTLKVGSQTAWVLPDASAKAVFLEFTGQGLQSLEKALQEKQGQLASLSARLLDNSKRGSEAADTVRLRYASETASLAMVVRATEAGLTQMYRHIAQMLGEDPNEVQVLLNKEFLETRMPATDLVGMVKSYLEGGISAETLVFNMRRGDIIPVDRDDDEEIAAVEKARAEANEAKKAKAMSNNSPGA